MNINIDHSQTSSTQNTDARNRSNAANVYQNASGGLKSIVAGEVLSGQVTSIHGNDIQITLGNDQVISARLTQNIMLTLGQMMSFQVKSNSGSQITLNPLMENMAQDSAAKKAIQASGIPMNDDTIAMTSAMMDEGMPINKESLQAMFRMLHAHPEAAPTSIVKLTSMGLPITDVGLSQLEAYQNHQHQIVNSVDTLTQEFSRMFSEGNMDVNRELLNVFMGNTDSSVIQELTEGYQMIMDTAAEQMLGADQELTKEDAEKAMISEEGTVKDNMAALQNSEEEDITPLSRLLQQGERAEIANLLKEYGLSPQNTELMKNGMMSPEKVLMYVKALMDMSVGNEDLTSRLMDMMKQKSFQKLLSDEITNQWMIEPNDVEDKENVSKMYKSILSQADRTLQIMNTIGRGDSILAKGTEQLKQNVNFLNQLNQVFAYVQLPLKMSQENAHGDLYVYSKRKNSSSEDGSYTALLHLDMEHMGTMDIHVTLKDGNQVKTHFYLQKEEMLDFIEQNIDKLNERLMKRGYLVSTAASIRVPNESKSGSETPDNMVLDEIMGEAGQPRMIAKYSFDVRA